MKLIRKVLVFVFFLFTLSPGSNSQSFVKVESKQFILDKKPYYFAGTNMWYAFYLGSTPGGRERLVKELDTLKSLGLTNIRICGGTEKSNLLYSFKRNMQSAPGVYDDSLLVGLDFTLAEMGKRGMKAVIFLTNFWPWSGGTSQYVNWVTGKEIPDPHLSDDWREWQKFMDYSASFYTNAEANKMFRNHIDKIINRVNTFTGVQYRNDPAIMTWELANEPRPCPDVPVGPVNIPAFITWAHETASYIHSIDPNRLVTTGTEGKAGCKWDTAIYMQLHNHPSIDYADFHVWARNWQWFDCQEFGKTLDTSKRKALDYINEHIVMAERLGKPVTLEEFGLERDNCHPDPGTPVTARDSYLQTLLACVYENAEDKGPLAGSNIWAWGGYGKPHPKEVVLDQPYAMVGDQLEEMQGLNSVYVSDSSTLVILKSHADSMKALSGRKHKKCGVHKKRK